MFSVNYNEAYVNTPELCAMDDLTSEQTSDLEYKRVRETCTSDSLFLAYNLVGLTGFYAAGDDGYRWSSRAGVFNTVDEKIAIVAIKCYDHTRHYKLEFLRQKLALHSAKIGFFKILMFDEREVYYIPYELKREAYVRQMLEKDYHVKDILCSIRPDGTRICK